MTQEFNQRQYQFILNRCQTDEQRRSIEEFRELLNNSYLEETSTTKHIFYKNSKGVDIACIRLVQSEESIVVPEVIIRIPTVKKMLTKSSATSRKYGFLIGLDGEPLDLGCTYRSNDYKPRRFGVCGLREITKFYFLEAISHNSSENLTKLIRGAIQEYSA